MGRLFVAIDRWLERLEADGEGWTRERVSPGSRLQCVTVDPRRPNRLFCGSFTDGLLRSTDGGATFERVGEAVIGPDAVMSVHVDPSDPDCIYAGTEPSQLYRSENGGTEWEQLEGIREVDSVDEWAFPPRPDTDHVRCLAIAPDDPERLYVGIEAGATLISRDRGASWIDRPDGSRRDPHWLSTHSHTPERVYMAAGDGFAISQSRGERWEHPQEGLDHRYVWGLTLDAEDPDRVLVSAASGASRAHRAETADSYVYRWDGNGPWESLEGSGLPMGEGVMRSVLASGSEGGEYFAANNHGVYRSRSGGDEWESLVANWTDDYSTSAPRGAVHLP